MISYPASGSASAVVRWPCRLAAFLAVGTGHDQDLVPGAESQRWIGPDSSPWRVARGKGPSSGPRFQAEPPTTAAVLDAGRTFAPGRRQTAAL